jgi:predicted ester cyclase
MPDVEINIRVGGGSIELGAGQGADQETEESLRVVREHVAAIQAHDLERLSTTTDESFVLQSDALPRFGFPSGRTDRQGYLNLWRHLWEAIPGARYDIERGDLFGRGDTVVCCWWGYGTHLGEWAGAPPSGQQLDTHGCSIFKVRKGKIVADFDYFDTAKVWEQAGVLQQGGSQSGQWGPSGGSGGGGQGQGGQRPGGSGGGPSGQWGGSGGGGQTGAH